MRHFFSYVPLLVSAILAATLHAQLPRLIAGFRAIGDKLGDPNMASTVGLGLASRFGYVFTALSLLVFLSALLAIKLPRFRSAWLMSALGAVLAICLWIYAGFMVTPILRHAPF